MNVTTLFNTQDMDNIHSSHNIWWICRVSTADSPHNWQYLLLAHWMSQYISSIQNTPCIALSSCSNPAHYSDSNCTHPLTVYRQHAHHRHEQALAYHITMFTLWNYHTLHSSNLKGISNPTLVTAYVYKRITKGRKERRKEEFQLT